MIRKGDNMKKFWVLYGIILLSFIISAEQTINLNEAKIIMNQINIDGINKKYSTCIMDGLANKYGPNFILTDERLEYIISDLSLACEASYGGHEIERTNFVTDQFFAPSSTRSISDPDFPMYGSWSYNDQKYIWNECMNTFKSYLYCDCAQYSFTTCGFSSFDSAANWPLAFIGLSVVNMMASCPDQASLGMLEAFLKALLGV